ncbi:hypothetical protein LQW54_013420 [Pestalotiopsis sp. IQ-011]
MAQKDTNGIQAVSVDQSSDGVKNTSEPETICPEIGRAPCYVVSASTGPPATYVPTSPDALRQELGDVSTLGTDSKYLVVVHGLPTAYAQVLSSELGMDPDFLRAVAARRRFKPKQGRQDHGPTTVVSFEYPLLLGSGCSGPLYDSNADYDDIYNQAGDEMEKPLVCPTSSSGSDGVVFCRVAAWQCEKKTVLFLDRPWQDPSSSDRPENAAEMNTLVTQVWECISSDESSESLPSTIEAAVHEPWVEFLDTLQPGMDSTTGGAVSLACEVQRRLEANLTASSLSSGGGGGPGLQAYDYARPNWQALLDRSERHRRLAFDIASLRARLEAVPVLWPPETTEKPRQPWYPDDTNSKPQQPPPMGAEENQRSLDRVSYLGGVLLPLSIVSGILSMGDTFGPGGDLFYVFWASGVPLTVLTLLVIYADSIRREVVYVQTSHSRGQSSGSGPGDDDDDGKTGWNRMGRVGQDEPVVVTMPDLESGYPPAADYSEQIPISVSEPAIAGSPVASLSLPPAQPAPAPVLEKVSSEPVATLQPRFGRKREKHHDHGGTWERRELGWMGAAMCMLRLSELKKQQRLPRAVRG